MLHKLFIHFSLVVLFAFAQMGVATHEISHFNELSQHENQQQKDQNAANHQCEQCISHAGIADGLAISVYIFAVNQSVSASSAKSETYFLNTNSTSYSARAPPQIT